jgi:DNA-3-methyladenine glycosylase
MPESKILPRSFYERSTLLVARELLGARLVRVVAGTRLVGRIIESEAYVHQDDLACHAKAGRTKRTAVMFGPPGVAYVYFTYGVHWMFNVVTEPVDSPAAVLLRAIEPLEGQEIMLSRRLGGDTLGPARLTQALAIDGSLNGIDLCTPSAGLWIESGPPIPDAQVLTGPRIGLNTVPEPWKSLPWRFRVMPSPHQRSGVTSR